MATAQQLWDDKQAKATAKASADARVETDKASLAQDTALAQQAATDEAASEATILAKFPEGKVYVFGQLAVSKLHGEIVEIPVGDVSEDLG